MSEEIINKIAKEVSETVENLGTEECEICERVFTDYTGKCKGYYWSISFGKGIWSFNLTHHVKEIWHKTIIDGTITDILLKALEGLHSGEWKEKRRS